MFKGIRIMEYWDLFDENRNKLNKKLLRGEKTNPGEYHIVVGAWIINDSNQILITQRHPNKNFPLTWECTKGALVSGEDSITGVLREIKEEIGIKLNKENANFIDTITGNNFFKDLYVFRQNIDIKDTKLQKEETVDIKWVTINQYEEMVIEGKMGPSAKQDLIIMKEKYKWN